MTRVLTVSDLKGRTNSRQDDGKPRPGTKLREMYDALRRGEEVHSRGNSSRSFTRLRDDYGMELQSQRGKHGFVKLVGEWEGPYFVPLERILQDDQ